MKGRILFLGGLFAAIIGGQAAAQIDGSPHDLATGGVDKNEICVYCHTPHAAAADAPLWNKPLVSAAYDTYDSTTIDGEILAVGSVSIACLTCHDGTQAVDAMINAPGTGLGTLSTGTAGNELTGIANLVSGLTGDTDLTNDHPIGIRYGGGDGVSLAAVDPDFVEATSNGLTGANQRWWVNTTAGGTAAREKEDMILYTRNNGTADLPYVECASCHDPHEGVPGDDQSVGSDISFMRIANTNSDVCLACHVK